MVWTMLGLRKYFDAGTLIVMLLTLVFFVAALFLTGLSHDLLLEAGVFLVSVKLMIMSYKNGVTSQDLQEQLRRILLVLEEQGRRAVREGSPGGRGPAAQARSGDPGQQGA